MKSDRLIKIFIGTQTTPVLVQETTLRQASDYFGKAIDNAKRLGSGEADILRFPNDDVEFWQILLFWIFKREVGYSVDDYSADGYGDDCDEPDHTIHMCRAWIAADMYLMPRLQNKIMSELLVIYWHYRSSWDTAKMAMLGTAPDSALRRLYAEEITYLLRTGFINTPDLDELDGVAGLTRSILDAGHLYDDQADLYYLRSEIGSELRNEYMVKEA